MASLSPAALAVHRVKVQVHRARRLLADRRDPVAVAQIGRTLVDAAIVAEDRCALWNQVVGAEWALERGKVENLRVAARALDGLEFAAGQRFSFWAQVGPPLRRRGFVAGRELREGCVVPGVGGGLCLLSNGLFAAARRAGMEVLERHAHSRRPPGSRAALGEDATVAWNYVDLRFRAAWAWRLEVGLDAAQLCVRVRARNCDRNRGQNSDQARDRERGRVAVPVASERGWSVDSGSSCLSCGQPCDVGSRQRRRVAASRAPVRGRRSWLVDAAWPEYTAYLRRHGRDQDRLLAPLCAGLGVPARYAWPRRCVGERGHFPGFVLRRSLRSRRLADQGAARQLALLAADAELAAAMAEQLGPADVELVVAQTLLPFLWRRGALGGRRVTVLMQRLPLFELQARLDEAAAVHGDSPTLADFRADPQLLADEAQALEQAAAVVTPHAEIAALFAGKVEHLAWQRPAQIQRRPRGARRSPALWLPASTCGRKGAYELRSALARLSSRVAGLRLWVSGGELEGPGFWRGCPVELRRGRPGSLAEVDALVLPAWVEHQPRALLRAAAAGVPVVASRACGLDGSFDGRLNATAGVHSVATGSVDELEHALTEVLRAARGGASSGDGGPRRADLPG